MDVRFCQYLRLKAPTKTGAGEVEKSLRRWNPVRWCIKLGVEGGLRRMTHGDNVPLRYHFSLIVGNLA